MLTIRAAQWPQDAAMLSVLNTEFETERIYRPVQEGLAFRLEEQAVTPALRKRYVLDFSDAAERQNWDCSLLVHEEGELAGFAAAQYTAWNRRVTVWHLYVMPSFRRRGVGSRLLNALDHYAVSVQARCLWLETQNVNYPAIQFYLRCGFAFCGFDASLYDPQQLAQTEQEETALFFSRPARTQLLIGNPQAKESGGEHGVYGRGGSDSECAGGSAACQAYVWHVQLGDTGRRGGSGRVPG